jgi:hypothetical protein
MQDWNTNSDSFSFQATQSVHSVVMSTGTQTDVNAFMLCTQQHTHHSAAHDSISHRGRSSIRIYNFTFYLPHTFQKEIKGLFRQYLKISHDTFLLVRFQVLTASSTKMTVLWNVREVLTASNFRVLT